MFTQLQNRKLRWVLVSCVLLAVVSPALALAQQVTISRVELMPNMPSPYVMRDWKTVAMGYDSLVFDFTREDQYLPLIFTANGVNYPSIESFGLMSYVGGDNSTGEGINVIPAVVGASLAGINKSDQDGVNWVEKCQEWYNKSNGLKMYLNNPVSGTGGDWWYETMPNIFFYQLYDLYPGTGEFATQLVNIADRLLEEVDALGGSVTPWTKPNFNYTAFSFSSMSGVDRGWKQPEAGGAIAWLLYSAYVETGNEDYRIGAELSMDYLQGLSYNPSYEIQMPYGVYAAARMNAELGTNYNISKMINWVFDESYVRGDWGAVVGTWGGYDVSGLIGEMDTGGGYSFAMNGYQTASALAPVARYDDRFARAIGKWILNLANASRLYYTKFLPDALQDGEDWSHQYDPTSVLSHEALRESWYGASPFATGDAVRIDREDKWAETNFALYGSSHVGYLASIVDTTDVEGILRLDARATDFFQTDAYPTYLYYNPHDTQQSVTLDVGASSVDLYDLVNDTWVETGVSGEVTINIAADEAILISLVPTGATLTEELGVLYADGIAVDYSTTTVVNNHPPRIRSLSATATILNKGDTTTLYATASDLDGDAIEYTWSADTGTLEGTGASVTWTAPMEGDTLSILCVVSDGSLSDSSEIEVMVPDNFAPVISSVSLSPSILLPGESLQAVCTASDPDEDELDYNWTATGGIFAGSGSTVSWTAPNTEGAYTLYCEVTDPLGLSDLDSANVVAGDIVLQLPFTGNTLDSSPFGNDGTLVSGTYTADYSGVAENALYLDGAGDYVNVPNSSSLNSQGAITLAFWMRPDAIPSSDEWYIVSHGSWENRWKITLKSDHNLRWTVKTSAGIWDLDNLTDLSGATWYFVVATFGDGEMAVYLNGLEDVSVFKAGQISTTSIDLTIGQKDPGDAGFNFKGILDEVRIYNRVLSATEIEELYQTTSVEIEGIAAKPQTFRIARAYPNPFNASTSVVLELPEAGFVTLSLYNILGQHVKTVAAQRMNAGWQKISVDAHDLASGVYLLQMTSTGGQSSVSRIHLVR